MDHKKRSSLLRTIAVYMVVLWLLVIAISQTVGGLIHILPVMAVILVLIDVIQRRRSSGY